MSTPTPHDPVHSGRMTEETDIGSGEKHPGQKETDAMIRQIPPLPEGGSAGTGEPAQADSRKPLPARSGEDAEQP